jgi:type IV secretion system protein VirD4
MDWFTSWAAGGLSLGLIAVAIAGVVIIGGFALVVIVLLAETGILKWLFYFALAAIPMGIWVHFHNKNNPTPAPVQPLRQRQAGIHGDACYAPWEDVQARGLFPPENNFSASVYLGEYLNWYTPINESWQRTGHHLGYSGENNILTVAPAGTGKFTTSIAPTLLLNMESMFVVDVKGESYAVTARHRERQGHKVVAINPFNMFGDMLGLTDTLTSHFNPLAGLDPGTPTFTTQIDALAAAMIVHEGTDPHWSNRARDLLSCLMAHVASDPAEREAGNNSLPRVRQILGLPRDEFTLYMMKARSNPLPRVQNLAGSFTDPTSKEIDGILSTAIGQLAFLDQPMIADFLSRSDFDFRELRTQAMTIYFMLPPNELNTYYRFARLIVQACLNALSVEPKTGDRRVLLLLDEQAQLKSMDSIVSAIALLRGYKVRIWSVFQDLSQLESLYKERWESFIANAGIVQVFTTNDEKTATYFSDKAGNFTGQAVSTSTSHTSGYSSGTGPNASGSRTSGSSTSTSVNLVATPFLPVQVLYGLPEWHSVLFVRGSKDTVPAFKQPYYEAPFFEGMHLPNPYHDAESFRKAFRGDVSGEIGQ